MEKYHFLNNKKFFKDYLKANWNMIVEIILIEKDKFRELKYCYLGIRDFLIVKWGNLKYKYLMVKNNEDFSYRR